MKIALVTGGTGFLGVNLIPKLIAAGYKVRMFCRRAPMPSPDGERVETFVGELHRTDDWRRALTDVDAVFHVAACTSMLRKHRQERQRSNVDSVAAMLSALVQLPKAPRLVHCSSVGTVGISTTPKILDEDSRFNADHIDYFLSKKSSEDLVLGAHANRGLDAVIVNPATLVGIKGVRGIQAQTLAKLATGRQLVYPPGGSSFCDVEEVASGMLLALERGRSGERYILGGHNLSFHDYFSHLGIARTGKRPRMFKLPGWLIRCLSLATEQSGSLAYDAGLLARSYGYYSSAKAERELGYHIAPMSSLASKLVTAFAPTAHPTAGIPEPTK